jgi:hypothetical protein
MEGWGAVTEIVGCGRGVGGPGLGLGVWVGSRDLERMGFDVLKVSNTELGPKLLKNPKRQFTKI